MRKDIKEFLKFLDDFLGEDQKLHKWQKDFLEKYLEERFVNKEKANDKVSKGKDNKLKSCRSRRLPDGSFRGYCFRERRG